IVARLSDAELQARRRREGAAGTQRRRGVIPGRRRKAADEATSKDPKGKATAEAVPAEEQLPDDTSQTEVEPGATPEPEAVAVADEPVAEAEVEPEAEESAEEKATRYASLGREETETTAPAEEEEGE
ncbi:MAG TPA: hypothetical protein VGR20_04820, partial [Acidimicrobiia bacterium]|nr:hypothetical protein [Acidimicrobiia bacterium]